MGWIQEACRAAYGWRCGAVVSHTQEPIQQWLRNRHARRIDLAGAIKAYSIGGELLIYQDMGEDGWQVFIPVRAVKVDATLAELDNYYPVRS